MGRRGRHRREVREASVADASEVSPPDVLLDQMRLHRVLVDLVLELEEPYRSTVVARFVEGKTAASIARSLDIPESTVRWRLREALVRLRAGLDEKTGTRKAWAPAVLAFGRKGVVVAKSTKTIVVVVALIALILGGVVFEVVRHFNSGAAPKDQPVVLVGRPRPPTQSDGAAPDLFAARNAPPRKIAGRVTYLGAPIKDVVVTLQSMLSYAHVTEPVEARTDANGRFDFGIRAATRYDVSASSTGTTAAIVQLDLANPVLKPPSDQVELRLGDCTTSIEGTVFDASGNRLPKVHVGRGRPDDLDDLDRIGVESDDWGHYKLCAPIGSAQLAYAADGFGTIVARIEVHGEMHRDVVLVPEATLTVRVVRADDGQLVPHAYVIVAAVEFGLDRAARGRGVTDNDGQARISGLVPGRYHVVGFADGGLVSGRAPPEALAQVGVATEVVLKLEASARIRGTVLEGAKPVAGAQIFVGRIPHPGGAFSNTSQSDGSFILDYVPAGDLVFGAAPFEVDSPRAIRVEAGKSYDDVVVRVHRLATIRGRVTRLGKPVAAADVCCIPGLMPPRTPTDADGKYEFRGVPAGTYSILTGNDTAFTRGETITVGGSEERVLDLELDLAGTIAGVVVDRDDKPVAGVCVVWQNESTGDVGRAITDSLGRYRCGSMTGGGTYRASVVPSWPFGPGTQAPYPTADGGPYPTLGVKDGTTTIEGIKLAIDYRHGSISGHVVDDSGAPITDAVVEALAVPDGQAAQFTAWLRLPRTSTDGEGAFTMRDLATGHYALRARAADGSEGTTPAVSAGTSNVSIRVERAGSIEGKLINFKQPPAIEAQSLGELKLVPGTVDGATFRIVGLRPGRYLVHAHAATEGEARVIDVQPGVTTNVDLTAQGQAVIEGTVIDFRTRAPIADASCSAVMTVDGEPLIPRWDPTAPKSDASGHVRLDPTPSGNVTVTCTIAGASAGGVFPRWSVPSADVTVAAGGHAVVQLMSVEAPLETSTIGIELTATAPRITGVRPDSPAGKAGMAVGDQVTQVNGVSVQGLNGVGMQQLIASVPVGEQARITVLRGSTTMTFIAQAIAGF
jgi:protocatechuate 3,4-dioxygenase beta subunit